ncbi:GMC family oxidoreductase [Roseimicrobium sp. ORNL1]|uniref:GMC family oxidoreductase n=1 Tax=Roseimicrobium sp. ORNL1 TaxID=2711231 RepID=UPI0013E1E560|nr:GMC family oxidoreductase [Roseimicrobium sp. ORNL1]QIF02019.1 GMC family oxidoreductase [Roseimicrobium sp. ORNL1]
MSAPSPEYDYDVIIIGAGVCGAIAAAELASCGRVLILEAGPDTADRMDLVASYARAVNKNPGSPYRDPDGDKYAPTPDNSEGYYVKDGADSLPFKSTYVRRSGGSTWHFLGNTPRFVPSDFMLCDLYKKGVNWPLRYDDLEEDYCRAEEAMGVSGDHDQLQGLLQAKRSRPFPMTHVWESYSDRVIGQRLNGLVIDGVKVELLSTPQARNSRPYDGRPACAGNSSCVPICPIQAKYDGTVHVRKAVAAGVEVRTRSVVFKLEADDTGKIQHVHVRSYEGVDTVFTGRIVVLAAHAIESARLLLLSELPNSSGLIGCNLMDHLQGAVVCLAPEPVYGFRGPPTTSGIDHFRDGEFRSERAAFRLSLGNDGWGRTASPADVLKKLTDAGIVGSRMRELAEWRLVRQLRFSFSTEMLPKTHNRIILDPDPEQKDALGLRKPRIHFEMDAYSRAGMEHAGKVCEKIFKHCGGDEVTITVARDGYNAAGHIMGTLRMGEKKSDSVVDRDGRAHDHSNLFVLGASVFPTCGTGNPTLTAVALTYRSVRAIKAALAPESAVLS